MGSGRTCDSGTDLSRWPGGQVEGHMGWDSGNAPLLAVKIVLQLLENEEAQKAGAGSGSGGPVVLGLLLSPSQCVQMLLCTALEE